MPPTSPPLELSPHGVAAGGEAVARDADGRVVFVGGALPGERVRVELVEERRAWARGVAVEVLDPSPDRVAPPCPGVAAGCGGCGWQHVAPSAQRRLKVDIVADALRRLGRIDEPEVHEGPVLPTADHRTTVRAVVQDGRAGYRRSRSHDAVAVDDCLVAHPLLVPLLVEGRYPGADEVTLRAGARTGERLVVADATAEGASVPDHVTVVGLDELRAGRRAWIHEEVAGHRFRVSARSFFQARPDGADALVALVGAAAAAPDGPPSTAPLADLYAGVGLFARALGEGRRTVAVEWSASSVADARHNLAGLDAKVVKVDVPRWQPRRVGLVVADPPRTGLGEGGVGVVDATRATRLVLVSCDPAALGRDAALLAVAGFRHAGTTLVDLFPHTPHVEAVTRFDRRT